MSINEADETRLTEWAAAYPGLRDQFGAIDRQIVPTCPHCRSTDTAVIIIGISGRTVRLAALSAKVKLMSDRDEAGTCWCRTCARVF